MTRPQATMAFLPISNRSASPAPERVAHFGQESKDSWYNIAMKKKGGKTTAEVLIYDEIGIWGVTAKDFVKELSAVEADEIKLRINSPGGDVFDGVAIYNALRMHSAPVSVQVDGLAASAASFIAQAGDEVVMLRGSELMIHDASAFAWGNEQDMLKTAEILGKISNSIADIYAQRAGGDTKTWRDIMREEMWYSPEEAVAAGLADSTLDVEDSDAAEAKNGWDLKVFNYAGRKEAPSPLEEMRRIENRAKEAPVGKTTVKNEGEPQGTEVPEAPAAPVEENPTAEAEAEVEGSTEGEGSEGAVEPEGTSTNSAGHVQITMKDGKPVFMVNGAPVTDFVAVQRHISALEGARDEARDQARKDFIANLATNKKILASQVAGLEALVATMSDEQYALWTASWNAAPDVALLQAHGGEGGGQPTGTASEAQADRVEVLKGIVENHKRGGMAEEKIKNTNSYKELVSLVPDYHL